MKRFNFNQSLFSRLNRFRAALCDEDFKAAARVDDDGKVELVLHGVVDDWWEEMDSLSVASFLARHKDKPVHVRMNSEGGLVFDGIAIYQALVDHPQPVTGTIEALAASAMSVISQGVDHFSIAGNALFMVHRAWGVAVGNKAVMRDVAETLTAIDDALIATFVARTGLPKNKIEDLLDGEVDGTWLSAEQALEKGFVDEVLPLKASDSGESNRAYGFDAETERLENRRWRPPWR